MLQFNKQDCGTHLQHILPE